MLAIGSWRPAPNQLGLVMAFKFEFRVGVEAIVVDFSELAPMMNEAMLDSQLKFVP